VYNIRYHIASLVGVFLALALGLVLGGLVVQQGAVGRQQGALVEGLRKEFADLREENRGLSDENAVLEGLSDELFEVWATDRLADSTVLIVVGPEQEDDVLAATRAVEAAGGRAAVVTLLEPRFGLDSDEIRSAMGTDSAGALDLEGVTTSLVAEWGFVQKRPLTEALVEAGALRVEGLDAGDAASGLVCMASIGGEPDTGALALAVAFEKVAPAIGAERADALTGVARAAHRDKLAALDNLGTASGRYTLIALLSGAQKGLYGIDDDAVAVFPAAR
jgi:hypothetical protein